MRKLVKWGRGKYLDHLYGDVLEANEPMKQLAASLGFKAIPHPQGTPGLGAHGAGTRSGPIRGHHVAVC